MVYIHSFLPNPEGKDLPAKEVVTIANEGSEAISLAGWSLRDAAGKTAELFGDVSPQGSVMFSGAVTGIRLNNSDEAVSLFSPDGILVDTLSFVGSAASGKAVVAHRAVDEAVFAELFDEAAFTYDYSIPGITMIQGGSASSVALGALPVALILASVALYIIRAMKHHYA